MATPPQGDPFAESAGEAVQTAVLAVRLVLAIADATRRHQQRRNKGAEEELPPSGQARDEAETKLKDLLPPDIPAVLTAGADWPQMAWQLMALQRAGVDLEQLLPRVGEIAVNVRDTVIANEAWVTRGRTGEWERTLRETLPAGPVREAILSSPTWPDIVATMARLDERGVDVRRILASAHDEGLGVDQPFAKVFLVGEAPTTSRDAMLSYGPLTDGLDIPKDLDLGDRTRAFRQLSIGPYENEGFVRLVREAMPDREREVSLMVTAKQWPLVAARMAKMESEGKPIKEHLAGLVKDTSWERGQGQLGSRLALATANVLSHPPGGVPPVGQPKVSTRAARSRSSTTVPVEARVSKGSAHAGPGVAAHRQAGSGVKRGRNR